MSLSSALSIATSGLTTSSRAAHTTTENIANAATPGYAKRNVEIVSGSDQAGTAGVRVIATERATATTTTALRRNSDAGAAAADVLHSALRDLSRAVGEPGNPTALPNRLTQLESAFTALSATPESTALQNQVFTELDLLTTQFRSASERFTHVREDADRAIAGDVATLNSALESLQELNVKLMRAESAGRDLNTLVDQREALIDDVNRIVPVRVVAREGQQISLFTVGGRALLDTGPAQIGFTPSPIIGPNDTVAGTLSGVSINGAAVTTDLSRHPLRGGTLVAALEIRDTHAVAAQAALDAIAGDLMSRFEAADASRAPGQPSLLTDQGLALDTTQLGGLSQRISVNAAINPTEGGAVWRIRDGAGAASPGAAADPAQANAFVAALRADDPGVATSGLAVGETSITGRAATLSDHLVSARLHSEDRATMLQAERAALASEEQDLLGVNTDEELQNLLAVEAAFEANARVVTVLRELFDTLLGL
jgi:flagellar hook-associated protein 1 FlgK